MSVWRGACFERAYGAKERWIRPPPSFHPLLLANGSDSFGRSVIKEIKLGLGAPDIGQYQHDPPPPSPINRNPV